MLYLHLHEAALTGEAGGHLGQVENTRTIVTADTIRGWLGRPGIELVVKPVLDLAERIHTTAYEIPDRLKEQVILRDRTCAFPYCNRHARGCDQDHVIPWPEGETESENLAPLCRLHHRLKTFDGWAYQVERPGSYLWCSPHGHRFRRDHVGTEMLDPEPQEPEPHDPDPPPDS